MLSQLYRVGFKLARDLINHFGSIGAILNADEEELN